MDMSVKLRKEFGPIVIKKKEGKLFTYRWTLNPLKREKRE